jgi:hypothetical protein
MSSEPVTHSSRLVFHLYSRSLHPELFVIEDERQLWRDDYRAIFRIVESGHLVTFQTHRRTLTEALLVRGQELPVQRRIAGFSFEHNPQKSFRYDDSVRYDARFDLREMDLAAAEREIRQAVMRNGFMVRSMSPPGRPPALAAMSYVTGPGTLSVRTHRTFPAESLMLVTHSRWEVRY